MRYFFVFVLMLVAACPPATAAEKFLDIQEVKSESGITAWLVEDHTLPIIALHFAFLDSGSALETPDKQGLVRLLSNTMDEGAGDLTSEAFQKALLDHSISLSFSASRDSFGGSLKTLSEHKDEAFRLMQLALNEPRFDAEPVARMKEANLSRIRSSMTDPEWMAARLINDKAFAGHPYALNSGGTLATLAALTREDLKKFHRTYLTRDRLIVAAAGDITAAQLAPLLESLFRSLPANAPENTIPQSKIQNAGTVTLYKTPIPQTILEIMLPAFGRSDPDYYALQVMNYIYGGAGFGSRLMEEVREKRGLTYGIYSSVRNYRHLDAFSITTSVHNDKAHETLMVIEEEMRRLVNEPVSGQEIEDAKSYLVGSMPLALNSTDSIAGILLSLQEDGLPIDYLDQYADSINAVRARDIQRVAARILSPDSMTTALVGEPLNIEPTATVEVLPNVQ